MTPLMWAATRGEVECVRLLLAAGADPRRRDSDGRRALDHAVEHHATWAEMDDEPLAVVAAILEDDSRSAEIHTTALAEAEETVRLLRAATGEP